MGHWNVADVMTPRVVYVYPDTPFKEIVDLLELNRINAVPVVDDDLRVVGIVSSADLVTKIEFAGDDDRIRLLEPRHTRNARAKSAATAAAELMSAPATTITGSASIVAAAKVMERSLLKRLPVVDPDGRLVGMVTRADLLKVFLRRDAQIRCEIVDEVLEDLIGVEPSQVAVEVSDGVVTLRGRLDRRSLIPVVKRQVERVDGVVDLVSYLGYAVDDTRATAGAGRPPLP
jgi:CBS domain-containing protein